MSESDAERVTGSFPGHPYAEHYRLRDEIAETDIVYREQDHDLEGYERREAQNLGTGDNVLHEGVWAVITQWIHKTADEIATPNVMLRLENAELGLIQNVIVNPDEEFYIRPRPTG